MRFWDLKIVANEGSESDAIQDEVSIAATS